MYINILQWNACSLNRRTAELRDFLAGSVAFDVICVQETFLKEGHNYKLPGYAAIRKDRVEGKRGGVATFIRDNMSYSVLDSHADFEAITVKIKTRNGYITVVNIYIPPEPEINFSNFESFLMHRNMVLVGDLNAKHRIWGSPASDTRGNRIEELLDRQNLCVINDGRPTYVRPGCEPSHLDVTVASNNLALGCTWGVGDSTLGSDHLPTFTTMSEVGFHEELSLPRWRFDTADWDKFKRSCKELIMCDDVASEDVDLFNARLTNAIVRSAEGSIKKTKGRGNRLKPVPYWNEQCKMAINRRNRARRKMQTTRELNDCVEYKRLKGIAQNTIKQASRGYWQDYCNTLKRTSNLAGVWKKSRQMNGHSAQTKIANLKLDDRLYETNAEKANLFLKTFEKINSDENYSKFFQGHKNDVETNHRELFENVIDEEFNTEYLNEKFQLHELRRAIKQSKNKSAPGEDQIPYEILKQLPNSTLKIVLKLYNEIWQKGVLPKKWKHALVCPISKMGKDPTLPTSYRPISLTDSLCKIMERLVTTRLTYYLEKNELLTNVQAGFRQNRSTIDQILKLQDNISKYNANKGHTLGVFIDFEKAYDMVWKNGLLMKLKGMGVSGAIYGWIDDFLTNRTIQVRVGTALSDLGYLQNGLPQGSVISPLLFLVMVNDLPTGMDKVETSLFADDSALYQSGRNVDMLNKNVQAALDQLQHWCSIWGFKISTDKTVGVLFSQSKMEIKTPLKINGVEIKMEKNVKFLGVIFDRTLSWNAHVDYIVEKCKKRLNLLRSLTSTTWGSGKAALLTVYRALIRSILDYGAEAFDSASAATKAKLDLIQARALRICCGANIATSIAALQVEMGEMPQDLRRRQQQLNYAVKISATENHPNKYMVEDHWTTHYGKFKKTGEPFLVKVKTFLNEVKNVKYEAKKLGEVPPWQLGSVKVDTGLTKFCKKKEEPPEIVKSKSLEYIEKYKDHLHIFTDGSKTSEGRVAAAYYVPSVNLKSGVRINDSSSVYTAELTAIKLTLTYITQHHNTANTKVVILSDSLSSLTSIDVGRSASKPNLLNKVLGLIDRIQADLTFVWIPSHVDITGNEIADQIAGTATSYNDITHDVELELHEMQSLAERHIMKLWQTRWQECTTSAHYKTLEPAVSKTIKYTHNARSSEVLITRLRLGKCNLNNFLKMIKKHDTGNCASCGQLETIEHFLIHCKSHLANEIKKKCNELKLSHTLKTVLTDERLLRLICTKIDRKI